MFGAMGEIDMVVRAEKTAGATEELLGELGDRIGKALVRWNVEGGMKRDPHEAEWVSKKAWDSVVAEIAGQVMRNVNEALGLEGLPYGLG